MSDAPDDLERQIDELLSGRGGPESDPALLWLASGARPTPPPGLLARVEATVTAPRTDRPGPLLAAVAMVLAVVFVGQGLSSLFAGEWIAEGLGEPYGPHPFRELGLAVIAIGVCAAGAAVSRRWGAVSVLTCAPLAVAFGLHGTTEIGVFGAGVALHLAQGLLGLLLVAAWWRDRRDTPRVRREDRA